LRSWATDAAPVKEIVERFLNQSGMANLPLFFTGCSCGWNCCRPCCLVNADQTFLLLAGQTQAPAAVATAGACAGGNVLFNLLHLMCVS
jgi:hypothetical protein